MIVPALRCSGDGQSSSVQSVGEMEIDSTGLERQSDSTARLQSIGPWASNR